MKIIDKIKKSQFKIKGDEKVYQIGVVGSDYVINELLGSIDPEVFNHRTRAFIEFNDDSFIISASYPDNKKIIVKFSDIIFIENQQTKMDTIKQVNIASENVFISENFEMIEIQLYFYEENFEKKIPNALFEVSMIEYQEMGGIRFLNSLKKKAVYICRTKVYNRLRCWSYHLLANNLNISEFVEKRIDDFFDDYLREHPLR